MAYGPPFSLVSSSSPRGCSHEEIEEVFGRYGKLCTPGLRFAMTKKDDRFYIDFEQVGSAMKALSALNGQRQEEFGLNFRFNLHYTKETKLKLAAMGLLEESKGITMPERMPAGPVAKSAARGSLSVAGIDLRPTSRILPNPAEPPMRQPVASPRPSALVNRRFAKDAMQARIERAQKSLELLEKKKPPPTPNPVRTAPDPPKMPPPAPKTARFDLKSFRDSNFTSSESEDEVGSTKGGAGSSSSSEGGRSSQNRSKKSGAPPELRNIFSDILADIDPSLKMATPLPSESGTGSSSISSSSGSSSFDSDDEEPTDSAASSDKAVDDGEKNSKVKIHPTPLLEAVKTNLEVRESNDNTEMASEADEETTKTPSPIPFDDVKEGEETSPKVRILLKRKPNPDPSANSSGASSPRRRNARPSSRRADIQETSTALPVSLGFQCDALDIQPWRLSLHEAMAVHSGIFNVKPMTSVIHGSFSLASCRDWIVHASAALACPRAPRAALAAKPTVIVPALPTPLKGTTVMWLR